MKGWIKYALAPLLFAAACNGPDRKPDGEVDFNQVKDPLVNANRMLNSAEEDQINGYIKRHGWTMTKTPSGLRHDIYYSAKGDLITKGARVKMKYRLSLINGVEVYNSDRDGFKTLTVGSGDAENGLNEAVRLMRQGEKARLIIPSHLGFGLVGDENKIPARATLIYDIEIISVMGGEPKDNSNQK